MNSGIYLITNKDTEKQYVGQSVNIKRRFNTHKRAVKTQNPRAAFYLHKAMAKHGIENFTFETLLHATDAEYLNLMEQKCIASFNTLAPNGYNLDTGGCTNREISEETREKLRNRTAWNKGIKLTDEQKKNLSASMIGRPANNKGIPRTEEQKAKQSLAMKGKPAWNKGKPMSEEQKAKLSLVDKSYTKTPEYRAMMSEAVKKAKAKQKEAING